MKLTNIINFTPKIEVNRNYWLVRTMGGDYYEEYIKNSFIAIGYNDVFLGEINRISETYKTKAQKKLSETIKNKNINTSDYQTVNARYAAAQLLRYCTEIRHGDIVIVPSKSHHHLLSIGIVDSNVYEDISTNKEGDNCPFIKRLKIDWIKINCDRRNLNSKLQLMFNSRHIVSNVSKYSLYLDNLIHDYYTKGESTFLVINVKTNEDLFVGDLMFVNDILSLLSKHDDKPNDINTNDINAKICVQSPGDIILYATDPQVIFLVGLFIVLLNGGGLKIDKLGLNISTKGLIASISDFLDRRADRQLTQAIKAKLEKLDITSPEDIIKMIDKTKNERDSY